MLSKILLLCFSKSIKSVGALQIQGLVNDGEGVPGHDEEWPASGW